MRIDGYDIKEEIEYEVNKNGGEIPVELAVKMTTLPNDRILVVDEEGRDFFLRDIDFNDYVVISVEEVEEDGATLLVREV